METVILKADYFTDGAVPYIAIVPYEGDITYAGSNVPMSGAGNLSVTTGSIELTANGKYKYTPPANPDMSTPVIITYYTGNNPRIYYAATTTIGDLYEKSTINMVSAFTGILTYDSNTNVPNGATVTASVGSVSVPSNGTYRYTPPVSFETNTPVTLAYIRQVQWNTSGVGSIRQSFHEHCSVTTTVGNLQGNGSLNLGFDQFVVTGRIRYTNNTNDYNNLQSVPNTATLTVTGTAGATGKMLATQRYELTIPGNAAGSATIRVSYTTGGSTYYAEASVNAFRANQYLQLRTNGGQLKN